MARFKPKISIVLLCIGLFFFFLILRFPYRNLRGALFSRIHKETGITILAEDLYLSLFGWPGIGLRNVDVSIPIGESELDVSSEKVIIRAGLGSLFPPSPSVSLSMKKLKQGGDLFLKFSQRKNTISADVEADAVEISQLALSLLPGTISGLILAEADIKVDQTDLSKTTGAVDIGVKKLKLPSFPIRDFGFVIPAMEIGPLKGKIRIKNSSVEFQTFQFGTDGSDLQGSLSGEIRLGQMMNTSSLNLTLKLKFSEQIKNNPQSLTLLSFLNSFKHEKSGGYAIKCSKSIPQLASCLIDVEKVVD